MINSNYQHHNVSPHDGDVSQISPRSNNHGAKNSISFDVNNNDTVQKIFQILSSLINQLISETQSGSDNSGSNSTSLPVNSEIKPDGQSHAVCLGGNNQSNNQSNTGVSVPTEPVEISGQTSIGALQAVTGVNSQSLPNSEVVEIRGQSYSIGALKAQADNYEQSDFVPTGAIGQDSVPTSWGVGTSAGTRAFESYISATFPNGLI